MRNGFTLIELLVVVTIIVVLMALLTPALDKAVYQAELATCGSRLKGIANGATLYASENRRAYPYRPCVNNTNGWRRAETIYDTVGYDDRPYLRPTIGLKNLLDPLAGGIDLEDPDRGDTIFANYPLWFGLRFTHANGGRGMYRLGDRLQFTDDPGGVRVEQSFSLLAGDYDFSDPPGGAYKAVASHPDRSEGMSLQIWANGVGQIVSRWVNSATAERSPLDTNFAYADGSVRRFNGVLWNDDRMGRVPLETPGATWPRAWIRLPKE